MELNEYTAPTIIHFSRLNEYHVERNNMSVDDFFSSEHEQRSQMPCAAAAAIVLLLGCCAQ